MLKKKKKISNINFETQRQQSFSYFLILRFTFLCQSATLLSGEEQPEPKSSNSDDSSNSEDEVDQKLDLLSTIK